MIVDIVSIYARNTWSKSPSECWVGIDELFLHNNFDLVF
jgi:hypothetical protein